jgi:hypothetical protein
LRKKVMPSPATPELFGDDDTSRHGGMTFTINFIAMELEIAGFLRHVMETVYLIRHDVCADTKCACLKGRALT